MDNILCRSGKTILTRVVFPDCRGPTTATLLNCIASSLNSDSAALGVYIIQIQKSEKSKKSLNFKDFLWGEQKGSLYAIISGSLARLPV